MRSLDPRVFLRAAILLAALSAPLLAAQYGDIQFIPVSGTLKSVPTDWVVLSSDGVQYKIQYVGGAVYGAHVTVATYSPVPPNWLIVSEDFANRILQYGGGAVYGARVAVVLRSPVPANWVILSQDSDRELMYVGNPPAYGVRVRVITRSPVPVNWVILSEDNNFRELEYVGGSPEYGTRQLVDQHSPVPLNWVILGQGSGQRNLMYVGGAVYGARVIVINQSPVPANWAIVAGSTDRRTIMYIGGSVAYGTDEVVVLRSPVPTNWVITREDDTYRTLVYVGGATLGARITVVPHSPVWPNWVITSQDTQSRHLEFVGGAPVGMTIRVTLSSPVPSGWSITAQDSTGRTLEFGVPVTSPPTGLTALKGPNEVVLNWDAVPGATSYTVKKRLDKKSTYQTIARNLTDTTWVDKDILKTYFYVVTATGPLGESAPSIEVSAAPLTVPLEPWDVVATPGDQQISLKWKAPIISPGKYYNVRRSTVSGGPYSFAANMIRTLTFVDTGLTNGVTYYYVVTSINASNVEGRLSLEVSATPGFPPATPTGLSASPGDAHVTLSWTAVSGTQIQYNVYRKDPAHPTEKMINASPVVTTNYTDSGLTNGTTYTYTVRAFTYPGLLSFPSDSASATPVGPSVPTPPSVPLGLTAGSVPAGIQLTWFAQGDAASFKVKWSETYGGPYTFLVSVTTNSYLDQNVQINHTYYYVVSALNSAGLESGNSTQVTSVWNGPGALAAPTNFSATANTSNIALSWNAVAQAASYNVKRSLNASGPFNFLKNVTVNVTSDTNVSVGTTYYYVVSAVSSTGQEGPNSAPDSATFTGSPAPGAPAALSAVGFDDHIGLGWSPGSGASSYKVKRSTTPGGPYNFIASTANTSYTDNNVVLGTTYHYVVSSVGSTGVEGANSPEASAQLISPSGLTAPTGLTATAGPSRVTLLWDAQAAATRYKIMRGTQLTANTAPFYDRTFFSNTNSYIDSAVVSNILYFYKVFALNDTDESAPSAEVSARPQ